MMEIADRNRLFKRDSETARKLGQIINDENDERWQVIFGFRSGYAKLPGRPGPRRSVEQVVRNDLAVRE